MPIYWRSSLDCGNRVQFIPNTLSYDLAEAVSGIIVAIPRLGLECGVVKSFVCSILFWVKVYVLRSYCTPPTVTTKAWAEPGLRQMAARAAVAPRASLGKEAEKRNILKFLNKTEEIIKPPPLVGIGRHVLVASRVWGRC